MLYSMRSSFVGLFQIIDASHDNGYVTYRMFLPRKTQKNRCIYE